MEISNIKDISSGETPSQQNIELRKASEQFVASFFYDILKKMYDSMPDTDLFSNSSSEKWYRDNLLNEYSQKVASEGLQPLVNEIYNQIAADAYKTNR